MSDSQLDCRKTKLMQNFSSLKAKLIRLYLQQPEAFASLKDDSYDTVGSTEVPDPDSIYCYAKYRLEIIY